MKRMLFFICCLTISTMMFAQNSFSKELFPILAGLQITECSGHLEENDVKYESYLTAPQEEITINDKKYLKWGMYSLREEKGKILVYSERQNKDFTLYDFTLKKGDTLTTLNLDWHNEPYSVVDYPIYSNPYEPETSTFSIDTLIVTEVSKITLLDGNEYKKWKFSNGWSYVEMIGMWGGDFFSFINYTGDVIGSYMGTSIVCISQNGQLLYQMPEPEMNHLGVTCKCLSAGAEDLETDIEKLFPTLAGLERTSFHYYPDDCNGNFSALITPTKIDTVINDKYYLLFDDFLLREEDNKVFIYSFVYNKDFVLYDYTLEVGDSLQCLSIDECYISKSHYTPVADYLGYASIDENGDCFVENKIPMKKIGVKEVSTVTLLDGKEYKKWVFNNGFEYIEGIGCVSSGNYFNLITPLAVPTCRFENNLVCISKNGQLLYSEEKEKQQRFGVACKCLSASAENPETDIEVIIAPTQTTQKIIRDGQLYIIRDGKTYNAMGVEVKNINF